MWCVPSWPGAGAYVTEHDPDERVQVVELKVPVLSVVKVTVPVGVTAVPGLVSVTVARQVVERPMTTVAGVQTIVVEVARRVAVRVEDPETEAPAPSVTSTLT